MQEIKTWTNWWTFRNYSHWFCRDDRSTLVHVIMTFVIDGRHVVGASDRSRATDDHRWNNHITQLGGARASKQPERREERETIIAWPLCWIKAAAGCEKGFWSVIGTSRISTWGNGYPYQALLVGKLDIWSLVRVLFMSISKFSTVLQSLQRFLTFDWCARRFSCATVAFYSWVWLLPVVV
jgi:hypothetical protein